MKRNKLHRQIGLAAGLRTLALAMFLGSLSIPPVSAGTSISISAEQWARVQSAADFMAIPGLKALVDSIADNQNRNKRVLEIHYAGGENGQLWAQQVRNRLVGLGLDSSGIEMLQGGAVAGQLQINARETR